MRTTKLVWVAVVCAASSMFGACGDEQDGPAGANADGVGGSSTSTPSPGGSLGLAEVPEDASRGERLYLAPFDDGNSFACATCHALQEPAADGLHRPGHPIGDAAARASFKNGQLTELRDAVNSCLSEWMNAAPLSAEDADWLALEEFLQGEATGGEGEAVVFDVAAPPADLDGGDAIVGMQRFNETCAVCHGIDAVGSIQAPSLIGAQLSAERIAERVRLSGRPSSEVYDGLTGGIMPFWSPQRMPDAELLDVVAFVEEVAAAERNDSAGQDGPAAPSGCSADHPSVGQVASLSTFSHQVAGTARIVDDCTIVIEDFHFDGGGINVQVYAGLGGDYEPPVGFSVSDNLLGQRFEGGTLTLTLPEGRTLDDLDGVSVWCVPVGVSFGDGLFEEP